MKINDIIVENKVNMSAADLEKAIRASAIKNNINPDIAVRVWQNEGGAAYQSNLVPKNDTTRTVGGKEASFGPFQLYTGGGLGNDYEKKYGVKLVNDNTPDGILRQIDFALKHVKKSGWTPWAGAKAANISKWQGVDFSSIQKSISNSGIKIDVDGVYGPKTKQAIKDFQKAQGLEVDGIIGPNTKAALKKFNSTEPKTTVDKPEKVDIPKPVEPKKPAGTTAAPKTSIRPNERPTTAAPKTSVRPNARPTTSAPTTSVRPNARPTTSAPTTSVRPVARPTTSPDNFDGISNDTKDAIDKTIKAVVKKSNINKKPNVTTSVPKPVAPKKSKNDSSGMIATKKVSKGSTNNG